VRRLSFSATKTGTLDSMSGGISLMGAAKMHWRAFAPAWVFPVFFLFGGVESERLGHPLLFFWLIAVPLFFWTFGRAAAVWSRRQLGYWPTVFWAILVPFLIWAVAVYTRLVVLRLLGFDHAV